MRLRQNFIGGKIDDDPLVMGGLSYNSPSLAAFSVIASPDYAAVVLDPDGVHGAPEIIWVTAHSTTATTATIERGKEGTSPRDHPMDTYWIHASTAYDFQIFSGNSIDNPAMWSADLGYDYEFEAVSSSLPSGWSWINQGSSTYTEQYGAGKIHVPLSGGVHVRGIVQSMSGWPSSWDAIMKLTGSAGINDVTSVCMILRQTSNGHIQIIRWFADHFLDRVTADDFDWTSAAGLNQQQQTSVPQYFRIVKHSSTSWDLAASADGITWYYIIAATNISSQIVPDQIGFGSYAQGANMDIAAHWFRVR